MREIKCPIHSCKAFHLCSIARVEAKGLLSEESILDIGWTKAPSIASAASTKKVAKQAVAYGAVHSAADLAS